MNYTNMASDDSWGGMLSTITTTINHDLVQHIYTYNKQNKEINLCIEGVSLCN
jgi:hypothetical protein